MKVQRTKEHTGIFALAVFILMGAFSAAALATGTQAVVPKASNQPLSTLAEGKIKLSQGKFAEAIQILEKTAGRLGAGPASCECRFYLGQAYCKKARATALAHKDASADYLSGRNELRRAIRSGRGNAIARQANQFMMTALPAEYLKPRSGEGTEMIAAMLGIAGRDRGTGLAKPKVFEFYADWCEPCKMLKPVIEKAKAQYGDQVEFVAYNVDDAKNEQFIDRYEVSPIPTVIFLSPDNQVVGYSIGFAGEKNVQKELQKILPDKG